MAFVKIARISLSDFWEEKKQMRIFARVFEEPTASPPSPFPAVPFGPSVAHPSLAAAVQARYAVAPGALHDQPFSARTERRSGRAARLTWRCRRALGWRMLAEPPQPLYPGMAPATSSHGRAASAPLPRKLEEGQK